MMLYIYKILKLLSENYWSSPISWANLQGKNTPKSVAFLYPNNKRSEREMKETVSHAIT